MNEAKNQINDLEYKEGKKINQNSKKRKESSQNRDRIRSLWDNFKHFDINIIGVPEGEEKEREIGNQFKKIMKNNFPNLVKEIDMQVQEVQRVPNKMDTIRTTPRHIIIKMPKAKD